MGYHRAGFDEIVGVDVKPQPNYPFTFVRADAMDYPLDGFDLIHASPPCQRYARSRHLGKSRGYRQSEVDLLHPTWQRLVDNLAPFVIENVTDAPDLPWPTPTVLCGSMFGLGVRRHRKFWLSEPVEALTCNHKAQGRPVGVYHRMGDNIPHGGRTAATLQEAQAAMGIDWMPWRELKEAIPPAYTEYIGSRFLANRGLVGSQWIQEEEKGK